MATMTCTQILLAVGMLISGSINTLSKKAQNDCTAKGLKDESGNMEHKFDHPWFQTGLMFIGESLCLIGLFFHRRRERTKLRENQMNINKDERDGEISAEMQQQPRVFHWIFTFPTICDLFGTTLGGIGLLYVNASVWQMLRGSIIVFTGILSKIFLKRKLWPIHWIGIVVTMFGLVLVGLSSVLRDNHKGSTEGEVILGILLILAGQSVSATQMIVEELFLKKRRFHPLQVVGMEGFFGVIFMACLVLPVLYYIPGPQNHNSYENSLDALLMIKNDTQLLIMSPVHRTLIDACRTIVVWVVSLFVHYTFHEGFGEAWDEKYGIFQVDGFLFLLLGTALYNELLIIPPLMPKSDPPQQQVQDSTNPDHDTDGARETDPLLKGRDQSASYTV